MLIQSVIRNKRPSRVSALQQYLVKLLDTLEIEPHAIIDMDGGNVARLADIDRGGVPLPVMSVHDYQRRLPALAASVGNDALRVLAVHAGAHARAPMAAATLLTGLATLGLFDDEPASRADLPSATWSGTLHALRTRAYTIRAAAKSDLKRLVQLEQLCWQHTRMSPQRIRARVTGYPQGQFVLEKDREVLAVVYSQRIDDVDALDRHTAKTVHKLHTETGATVQLLALNVDPAAQNLGLGDQLLEFTLQLCSVLPGVDRVVGVTLTKSFDASGPLDFDAYIQLDGAGQDPVLAFHKAHGADVVRSVPGYRPEDIANRTNGTLVSYDIARRVAPGRDLFADAGAAQQPADIAGYVQALARQVLDGECDPGRPLMEMGLDSADLLKMQLQLEQQYGLRLPGAFFFEYNTLNKVSAYLEQRLTAVPAAAVAHAAPKADTANHGDIAVIGMACRLPGGIDTPDALWQLLASSGSVIGAYPAERGSWPSGADYPGIDRGGFLADGARFDAAFFRINPHEAQITDPQQRILLELAWTCLEDAAVVPAAIKGSGAGVFIGASNGDYSRLVQEARIVTEAHHATGSSLAILANRLSYFFDLSGPSMLIDTACSSSLVALHTAVASIRAGECPLALVGGVNFICHPSLSIAYHKAGMLSPDASCKVFDANANGYVRAEGGVVMLLKPMQRAVADGDRIHAVIKGSAINHGGLAGGLTVPNPQKQSELIRAAWRNAGVAPQDLSYIEAHGTGTSLGDPIEVQGIQKAYGSASPDHRCALGSVKSNLGHLESAAGITGLLKVILAMQHKQLPASINFGRLNPKIALEAGALRIADALRPWNEGGPRIAGISSFGSGGANAHVVVQEYHDQRAAAPVSNGEQLFVVSATSQERLCAYVGKVIASLSDTDTQQQFSDMIYSWQMGRTALRQRLAIKAGSAAALRAKLQQWLRDPASVQDCWCSDAQHGDTGPDGLDQAIGTKDWDRLAQLWTSGIDIDWRRVHGATPARRIGLPSYPFGGERHWIATPPAEMPGQQPGQLFATPVWAQVPIHASKPAVALQHVVLCDFDHIDAAQVADHGLSLKRQTPEEDLAERYTRYALACFDSLQAILLARLAAKVLFQIVVPDTEQGAVLAGLGGMLKTASQENPQLMGQLVQAPADIDAATLAKWLRQERQQPGDAMVRYRNGSREVLTWQALAASSTVTALRDDGVYLITGGLGGLGRLFAREILQQCSRPTIILTGRGAMSPARQKELDALAAHGGGKLLYRQLDLDEQDGAPALIASIHATHQRLNGVIHGAGMIADNFILKKTPAEFAEVLAPKVQGLCQLDAACAQVDLDFMVLFSSFASAMGNPGQADYAAANGFMDQFAQYRNHLAAEGKRRGHTLSINWPLWKDGGMQVDASSLALLRQSTGMVPMRTETGMTMFHAGLAGGFAQAMVMEGDTSMMHAALAAGMHSVDTPAQSAAVNAKDLAVATLAKLKQLFGDVVGLSASKIDGNEALSAYGIDSIFINKLNVKLSALFGGISRTLFFEYATLGQLAGYLVDAYQPQCVAWTGLRPSQAAPSAPLAAPAPVTLAAPTGKQQPIAIIGISGIYPQAATLDAFWSNLRDGKNSVAEIPPGRWPLDGFYHPDPELAVEQGMSYSKWGGFIEQFAQFDPLFFSMSPREAINIDPQERLFLQEAWRAMENAGYTRRDMLQKYQRRVGVFAGITKAGFNLYAAEAAGDDRQFFPFTSFSSAANRVSYFLDITGPSMPVDTMCSSSLTAIHEACEHISRGECELAFAGGVNLYLHPSSYTWLSSQQMLSRDGLCKSFGLGGNGYVPGEGVGVVLLKPLARAIEDGDNIHGVIIGTHVNHGGKANAYTVPSPRAQADLISRALDKAGIRATDVSYIEAHGTGTELGDPIEISGLQQAFGKHSQETAYCKIGSAKSNIGHLESAAGIAGLTKVLLQLRHRQIAPTLHAAQLNPNIDFSRTAFQVNQHLTPWEAPQGTPRIAGISSFGAGGANAHILVQEYMAPARATVEAGTVLVPLSARTSPQLLQRARDLLQAIDQEGDLAALAYTLQVGREAMDERVAFLVDSLADLSGKLTAFVAGERNDEGVFHGHARGKATLQLLEDEDFAETLEKWLARRKLPKLADVWAQGLDLDWHRLYGQEKPRRLALPGYPFATSQFWVDTAIKARPAGRVDMLHPLLHRNTSELSRLRFTSVFSGAESFLNDHQVRGQKILPAVTYLEMARAAIELAAPAAFKYGVLELRSTVWARPMAVASATQVSIGLQLNPSDPQQIDFDIRSAEEMLHCQGQAVYCAQAPRPAIDIAAVRALMQRAPLDAESLYASFTATGIAYGPAHRAITAIHCGERQLLAQLELPATVDASHSAFVMHPSMMDCALQASIGLLDMSTGDGRPLMPFALDKLRVYGACTRSMVAWVRSGAPAGGGTIKFDVDLCDQEGKVCVQMEGFSSRHLEAAPMDVELHALAPVWSHVPTAKLDKVPAPASDRVVLLNGSAAQLKWLLKSYPQATRLADTELAGAAFDHLLWIAPDAVEGGDVIAQQEQGVLTIFRTAKALLNLGYADKALQWTVITANTQAVRPGDTIAPEHAAVFGMLGSLAKEYPEWRTRLLDVDSLASLSAADCLSMPCNAQGDGMALRAGEWFSQGLARINAMPQSHCPYRERGVYVIIGGAGGIGEAWSRFMASHYGAQLVWIGRQPVNAAIEEKINAISPAPAYFSADATDLASLQGAFAAIMQRFPRLHGVVNAAIVLQDQSVALMDEPTFRRALAAKVDVSVNIDKVFGGCDLDFLLYFSSLISFTKAAGQCNYAAGCTFKDSFALRQAQRYNYPVKIMNWGYWGSVGIVTSDFYNKRMQQRGVGSIQPDEAMAALQDLVGSNLSQIALMKTLERRAVDEISLAETVTIFPKTGVCGIAHGALAKAPPAELHQHLLPESMLSATADILASCLASLDLLSHDARTVNPLHQRWLASCTAYLKQHGRVTQKSRLSAKVQASDQLWATWDGQRAGWESNPNMRAQSQLLEACLKALPDVLSGKRLATDVMFPDSSMRMVEGIYRDNALSDFYNAALGETLGACITRKLAEGSQIRILEIGAGTGGTTSALLPLLQKFGGAIAEYCYTDLSKAFLIHAEQHYQPRLPALRTALFDASRPLAPQGMPENHFDFVIATNVLHATPNIRTTLRNAKAALKNQGVLLLNEMSVWSLFNHLTFGLLDGWWLYEDEALRLDGSPGLSPQAWHAVLGEVGFEQTWFPVEPAHALGQQVIAAVSDGVVRQHAAVAVVPVPVAMPVAVPLAGSGGTLREKTMSYLQELVAATLRMAPSDIEPGRPLAEYGLDSILVVGLTNQLRKSFTGITSTLFFEVQNIDALADYMLGKYHEKLSSMMAVAIAPEPVPSVLVNPMPALRAAAPSGIIDVAIVGLGGRYPRSASLQQFWTHLVNGDNCITEIPRDRWDWEAWFDPEKGKAGKIYSKWGGFLDDIDKFDPLFFKLSPKEAKTIDPQERLFLETCYHAIEDAGYTPATLGESARMGVFAGVMNARYTTQPLHYSIANRVSYLLNFQGPSMAVDTACSASLTAIHLALESLYSGSSECAIAGGVNLIIDPVHYLELSALTMLSGGNECRSFGANADGFVDAEGVGAVVLKPLASAERDGDHIYGVIKGSAINAGGRTNGYTVPNPHAQAAVVSQALERAGLQAWQISYIEAHGTGTALGDPIEIAGLTTAFGKTTQDTQFCAIGSLKSNIGHCESAAGIAGLTKVLLQLKHRQLVPSLHAEPGNPEIDFASTPFRVQGTLQQWQRPRRSIDGVMTELPRIAGISSFGAGGANAHLIVQEYDGPQHVHATGPAALVLSARTAEQLMQKARQLQAFIASEKPALAPLAYTLQVGREALEERIGFVADSIEALQQQLAEYVDGGGAVAGMWRGKINRHKQTSALPLADPAFQRSVEQHLQQGDLATLLDWWTQGARVEWNKLYAAKRPNRISLPVYPFARERYWRDLPQAAQPAMLHPLLHANVSTIRQQRYLTRLDGLPTSTRAGRVLPSVVMLEMARAAVIDALVRDGDAAQAELTVALREVVFGEPVILAPGAAISIALFSCNDSQVDFEIYSTGAEEGDETIHCQGHASVGVRLPVQHVLPASQRLAEIGLDTDSMEGMELHPVMLDGALQAACGLAITPSSLLGVDLVQLVRPCTSSMVPWARHDGEGRIDLDLCDSHGNVCVQLRGVAYESAAPSAPAGITLAQPLTVATPVAAATRPAKVSLAAPV